MRTPERTGSIEARLRLTALATAFVLLVAGIVQGLPTLWLGAIVAGGVTVAATVFGPAPATMLLALELALLWYLPPRLGQSFDLLDLVGMLLLVLPTLAAGRYVHHRIAEAERREEEQARRTRLLTEAAMVLQKLDNTDAIYRSILRMLADILEFTHATVFTPRGGRMHLIASHRWEVPSGFSIPMASVIGEAAERREPVYVPDVRRYARFVQAPNAPDTYSELAIPLMMEERVAAVLNIEHVELDAFGPEEHRTLIAFGKMVEEALERASLQMQLVEMLEVIRNLAQSDDPEKLFEATVTSAIKLIPGAEAGSLMVSLRGEFRFAAATGYDINQLQAISNVDRQSQLRWYDGSKEDFMAGVPRLLSGERVATASLASLATDDHRAVMISSGRLQEITANICVPISHGGNVLGMLNIDSFAPSNPFGPHALLLAETFAQHLAVIIRQALYRDALERAVVTDPLTGLSNREGFNRQLKVELARARRYGHPFSLVMFDLNGFKKINDRYGHQAGDRALARVARAMESQRRESDSIFRWAGDEFALILPETPRTEAWRVAERYAAAVGAITVEEIPLATSYGIAFYPEDGRDAETLLRKADDLMYRYKST